MIDLVEIAYNADLIAALDALGIPWEEGIPANGTEGTILVEVDTQTDWRLELLVGMFSELRWKYEPGRRLQLSLDLQGV